MAGCRLRLLQPMISPSAHGKLSQSTSSRLPQARFAQISSGRPKRAASLGISGNTQHQRRSPLQQPLWQGVRGSGLIKFQELKGAGWGARVWQPPAITCCPFCCNLHLQKEEKTSHDLQENYGNLMDYLRVALCRSCMASYSSPKSQPHWMRHKPQA